MFIYLFGWYFDSWTLAIDREQHLLTNEIKLSLNTIFVVQIKKDLTVNHGYCHPFESCTDGLDGQIYQNTFDSLPKKPIVCFLRLNRNFCK